MDTNQPHFQKERDILVKEIQDLKQSEGAQIVILLIPIEKYHESSIELSKQLDNNFKSVCYVSLNRMYGALNKTLQDHGIDTGKFFFVDGITLEAMPEAEEPDNCLFVPSAAALTDISITINQILETGQLESMLFDSLSTLLIYNKEEVVAEFVRDMVGNIRKANCVTIFTSLEGDTESALLKDLGMFVDKIIHLWKGEDKR